MNTDTIPLLIARRRRRRGDPAERWVKFRDKPPTPKEFSPDEWPQEGAEGANRSGDLWADGMTNRNAEPDGQGRCAHRLRRSLEQGDHGERTGRGRVLQGGEALITPLHACAHTRGQPGLSGARELSQDLPRLPPPASRGNRRRREWRRAQGNPRSRLPEW